MAEQLAHPGKKRRWLKVIGWAGLALVLTGIAFLVLVAIASSQQSSTEDLLTWQTSVGGLKRWGLLAQCVALALIVTGWRPIVGWAYRLGIVKRHELRWALRQRNAVLAWGVLYLLLVPIGPTTLWNLLVS